LEKVDGWRFYIGGLLDNGNFGRKDQLIRIECYWCKFAHMETIGPYKFAQNTFFFVIDHTCTRDGHSLVQIVRLDPIYWQQDRPEVLMENATIQLCTQANGTICYPTIGWDWAWEMINHAIARGDQFVVRFVCNIFIIYFINIAKISNSLYF